VDDESKKIMDINQLNRAYAEQYAKDHNLEKRYTHSANTLTDEEITIVKEAVGNYVCTIKMEIDQEKQTFKGYENCSNLPSLRSELKDAEQALAILRKAQEK
jgi:hypothetical protein